MRHVDVTHLKPWGIFLCYLCGNWLLFSFLFSLTSTWRIWKLGEIFLSRFCLKSLIFLGCYLVHQRGALENLGNSILSHMKHCELYSRSRKCLVYFQKLLYFHCLKKFLIFQNSIKMVGGGSFTRTIEVLKFFLRWPQKSPKRSNGTFFSTHLKK